MGPFLVMLVLGLACFGVGAAAVRMMGSAGTPNSRTRSTNGRPAGPLIRVRPDTPQRGTELHELTDWERP